MKLAMKLAMKGKKEELGEGAVKGDDGGDH
jgi:hypothetical protein